MRTAIQEEWDRITLEEINKLIDSMPARIKECHENKGCATRY